MRIAVRNSYESPVFASADAAIFFDVFRASTTLLALVSVRAERILSANDEATCRGYQAQGYELVSEVFAGGIDNSPAQVLAGKFTGHRVIHKSTNFTNAVFHNLGAKRLLIGALVNAERLVEHVFSAGYETVELIAASHFAGRTEAVEDLAGARVVEAMLKREAVGVLPEAELIAAKLARKRQTQNLPAHYWDDTRLALELNRLPELAEIRRLDERTMEVVTL